MIDFSDLPLNEVKSYIYNKPENITFLKDFFGNKNTLPNLEAGQYLTRENLEAYKELARRVISVGKDLTGVQARRIQQVDDFLKVGGTRDAT